MRKILIIIGLYFFIACRSHSPENEQTNNPVHIKSEIHPSDRDSTYFQNDSILSHFEYYNKKGKILYSFNDLWVGYL